MCLGLFQYETAQKLKIETIGTVKNEILTHNAYRHIKLFIFMICVSSALKDFHKYSECVPCSITCSGYSEEQEFANQTPL